MKKLILAGKGIVDDTIFKDVYFQKSKEEDLEKLKENLLSPENLTHVSLTLIDGIPS